MPQLVVHQTDESVSTNCTVDFGFVLPGQRLDTLELPFGAIVVGLAAVEAAGDQSKEGGGSTEGAGRGFDKFCNPYLQLMTLPVDKFPTCATIYMAPSIRVDASFM